MSQESYKDILKKQENLFKMSYPRLKEKYFKEIVPDLTKKLVFKSVMQVPRIDKICINQGLGAAVSNSKLIDTAIEELSYISGQRAVPRKAKRSVSNFKLREGMPIGVMVTLRGNKMYEFIDRFITISLPRVRDFRGINPKCFDRKGNCTIGVKEQIIFPEISIDKINKLNGMNITFVTNTTSDKEAFELLKAFGMPFKDLSKNNN